MIKLRKRPQEPGSKIKLRNVEIEIFPPDKSIYDEDGDFVDYENITPPTLAEIVSFFQEKGVDLSKVKPSSWTHYRYDALGHFDPKFVYVEWEADEDHQKKIDKYKAELKEYQAWYAENRDAVKAEKAAIRKGKEEEKKIRSVAAKKAKLKKQQEKIVAELEKME